MHAFPWRRVAALLLGLEGAALVVIVVVEVSALVRGDSAVLDSAIALTVMSAIGAAAVVAFAVAVWRGRSWGRSGGIVVQLLILAVAIGALTGAYAAPGIAAAIAVPGVVTLVPLVLAARDAARQPDDASEAPGDV